MGGEGRDSSLGWWGVCLWGTLTIVRLVKPLKIRAIRPQLDLTLLHLFSLCLGVAALWLPLDRHLQVRKKEPNQNHKQVGFSSLHLILLLQKTGAPWGS